MATLFHSWFFVDLSAGEVVSAADVRGMLVMTNTTCDTEEEALDLADFTTIDEADGVGYAQATVANVTVAWDATLNALKIDGDDSNFTSGSTLDACTRNLEGILWYRYVDGTDANDVPWFFSTDGGFPKTPSGGAATYAFDADGVINVQQQ